MTTGRLFRQGIHLKDGTELERLAGIDLVAFDKTGTLTDGEPRLLEWPESAAAWAVAAALAGGSRHPLSRAIAAAADAGGVFPAALDDAREVPGFGVEAVHGDTRVRLGRPEWVGGGESFAVAVDPGDGVIAGFRFAETLRPGAVETCARLRALGLDLAILSGGCGRGRRRRAAETGIADCHSRLRPAKSSPGSTPAAPRADAC